MSSIQQALLSYAVGGDPYFGSIVSLLHMNGTDASTTFTDVTGKTWTANGNAQIDTAQSKFGGASGLFDGTGDWIDTPDSADFTLGADDFTIEFWIRWNSLGSQLFVCGQSNNAGSNATTSFSIYKSAANTMNAYCGSSTSQIGVCSGPSTVTSGQWYHMAYVRNGTSFKLYIDGTAGAASTPSSATVNDSANKLSIGRLGEYNNQFFNGWVDDFRLTKGVARYTADFSPPTEEFPDE